MCQKVIPRPSATTEGKNANLSYRRCITNVFVTPRQKELVLERNFWFAEFNF
jgi:hypothetical protein